MVERVSVDQRDIQRMGGRRAKHPTAAVVDALLRPLAPSCVLETTYGEGRFYLVYRPPRLVGVDIARREWLVPPDVFFEMPVWAFYNRLKRGEVAAPQPQVVVCDPPWGRRQRRLHYWERWGSPRLILEYSVKVAELLGADHLLLHWGEEPPPLGGWELRKVVEFKPFTRYLNVSETRTYFALYSRAQRSSPVNESFLSHYCKG
jgi:hypothetical protein